MFKFKKILDESNEKTKSDHFAVKFKKKKDSQSISKNRLNLMQYTACLVFNPDTVKNFTFLSPVYTFTIFSTIHHDSPRFLMVRKIGMDRGESWRKVEIFSI